MNLTLEIVDSGSESGDATNSPKSAHSPKSFNKVKKLNLPSSPKVTTSDGLTNEMIGPEVKEEASTNDVSDQEDSTSFHCKVGDRVKILSPHKKWRMCTITEVGEDSLKIHYEFFDSEHDEIISHKNGVSPRICWRLDVGLKDEINIIQKQLDSLMHEIDSINTTEKLIKQNRFNLSGLGSSMPFLSVMKEKIYDDVEKIETRLKELWPAQKKLLVRVMSSEPHGLTTSDMARLVKKIYPSGSEKQIKKIVQCMESSIADLERCTFADNFKNGEDREPPEGTMSRAVTSKTTLFKYFEQVWLDTPKDLYYELDELRTTYRENPFHFINANGRYALFEKLCLVRVFSKWPDNVLQILVQTTV